MRFSAPRIIELVCAQYGITKAEVLSPQRSARFTRPRQVAMYLMRKYATHLSYPRIAAIMQRDHSSVYSGVHKITNGLLHDASLVAEVAALESRMTVELAAMEAERAAHIAKAQREIATLAAAMAQAQEHLRALTCPDLEAFVR